MLDLTKIKTYILHYTKLAGRRQYMEQLSNSLKLNTTWITELDQEDMHGETLDYYYKPSEDDWNRKVGALWDLRQHVYRPLKPAEISLTAKHVEVMKRISEDENDFGLIFEDDVLLIQNFPDILNEHVRQQLNI